jgi:S1-C subfamily serine protease
MTTNRKLNLKPATLKQAAIYATLPLLGAGVTVFGGRLFQQSPAIAQNTNPQVIAQSRTGAMAEGNFIADAAEKVGPAVVRINASRTVKAKERPEMFDDPMMRRFFGEMPDQPKERVYL